MFRSVTVKQIQKGPLNGVDGFSNSVIREVQEGPEDFSQCLIRTNSEFAGSYPATVAQVEHAGSTYGGASDDSPKSKNTHIAIRQNTQQSLHSPYQMQLGMTLSSKSAVSINEQDFSNRKTRQRTTSPALQNKSLTVKHAKESKLRLIATPAKLARKPNHAEQNKKRAYKLFSPREGAFAFKSEADFKQPFEALKFVEHDLAYKLEMEELEKTKTKGNKMILEMRRKLKKSVSLMVNNQKNDVDFISALKATQLLQNSKQPVDAVSNSSKLKKLMTNNFSTEARKGSAPEPPTQVKIYPMTKIRYIGDEKFPFQVLCDVPKAIRKALEVLNMQRMHGYTGDYSIAKEEKTSQQLNRKATMTGASQLSFYQITGNLETENELIRFLHFNDSGFKNMIVYLFWLILASWLTDVDQLCLPLEFVTKIRSALREQYRRVYFNYLLRLRQTVMDSIIDIFPYFIAEIVRSLIQMKIRNHELPLQQNKTFILLIQAVFKELYGTQTSELSIQQQRKVYIKSFADRIKDNAAARRNSSKGNHPQACGNSTQPMTSPHKSVGPLSGGPAQSGVRNASSIYTMVAQSKTPKAPSSNQRDYSAEIKQDMVNQMINEWSKLSSHEAKAAISDQIKAFESTLSPIAQSTSPRAGLAGAASLLPATIDKRRQGYKSHLFHHSMMAPQSHSKGSIIVGKAPAKIKHALTRLVSLESPRSPGCETLNNLANQRKQGGAMAAKASKLSPKGRPAHLHQDSMTIEESPIEQSAGAGFSIATVKSFKPMSRSNAVKDTILELHRVQPNHPISKDRGVSRVQGPKRNGKKVNHFQKYKLKVSEYEPQAKDLALEKLVTKIKETQERELAEEARRYEESATAGKPSLASLSMSRSRQASVATTPAKTQTFDLQHVSPIIQGKFAEQLAMNFDPSRKQKSVTIQKEPDADRVEPYKLLAYELKTEMENKKKAEADRLKAELEARANHWRARTSQNSSIKTKEQGQQQTGTSKATGKANETSHQQIKGCQKQLTPQDGGSANVGGSGKQLMSSMKQPRQSAPAPQVNQQVASQAPPASDHCDESSLQQSRNVRFHEGPNESQYSTTGAGNAQDPIQISVGREESYLSQFGTAEAGGPLGALKATKEASHDSLQRLMKRVPTPEAGSRQTFFYEKKDFMTAQQDKEGAGYSTTNSVSNTGKSSGGGKGSRLNQTSLKMLGQQEDWTSISQQMQNQMTASQKIMLKKAANKPLEKNVYDHNLMQSVRKSIQKKKHQERSASREDSRESQQYRSDNNSQSRQPKVQRENSLPNIQASGKQKGKASMAKSRSAANLLDKQAQGKSAQVLPPLGTDQLAKKENHNTAGHQSAQQACSRQGRGHLRGRGASVAFDDSRNELITMPAPFTEDDTGKQMFRKQSKILSKGKYKLVTDGSKQPPLHKQLVDYINKYADKGNEDYDKVLVVENMRRKLRNMLPASLRKSESEQAFKTPPPCDYLASKHTYSTMRKVSNLKSRKQFIFDEYDLEQKRIQAQSKISAAQAQAKSAKKLAVLTATTPDFQDSKAKSHTSLPKSSQVNTGRDSLPIDQVIAAEQEGLKTYHIYKGSNFTRGTSGYHPQDGLQNSIPAGHSTGGLPPRPGLKVNQINMLKTLPIDANQSLKTPRFSSQPGRREPGHDNERLATAKKSSIGSELRLKLGLSEDSLSDTDRRETEDFYRANQILNENDDKADVRDGIAETKGRMMKSSGEDLSRLKMAPKLANTKVSRMMKEMREYLDRESQRKEAAKAQNRREMEIVDSEEENERVDAEKDTFVARPNPLEIPSKKKRQNKDRTVKASSQSHLKEPDLKPSQGIQLADHYRKQIKQIRSNMHTDKILEKRTSRRTQYFD